MVSEPVLKIKFRLGLKNDLNQILKKFFAAGIAWYDI